MVNNYSTLGFWRSWHRSYNLWIVRFGCCNHVQASYSLAYRYIYIPLGGAKNVALTTVLVFSFVALWHDLSFRLLAWGWLVSFFILPELLARYLLPQTKVSRMPSSWHFHLVQLIQFARSVRAIFMVSPCLRHRRRSQHINDGFRKPCWICDRYGRDNVYGQPDGGDVAR
jgi:D-alanyl-lipoteichoic acid acyltransferase DltB (MBOAT superfamily)